MWFIKFLLVSCGGDFGKNCKSGSAIFVHKSIGMVVVVLYSIGTLSCMRERERKGGASRRVGGWVKGAGG